MLCLLVLLQLGTELLLAPPDVPEPDVDIHLDPDSLGTPLYDQETGLGPDFEPRGVIGQCCTNVQDLSLIFPRECTGYQC